MAAPKLELQPVLEGGGTSSLGASLPSGGDMGGARGRMAIADFARKVSQGGEGGAGGAPAVVVQENFRRISEWARELCAYIDSLHP